MIYIALSILIKMYLFFNAFQKSFYEYKSLFSYLIKNYPVLSLSSVSIGLLFIFENVYLNIVVIFSLLVQLLYLVKKSKVYLKITKRIVRLFLTTSFLTIIFSLFINPFIIDLILPLVIILADFINKPVEKLINKSYIEKAKNKIKNNSSIKIAITGSYGKTSVKNYIYDILSDKYIVKRTPHSYNTPLGISRFINEDNFDYTDFIIYEFGARRSNDIKELNTYYQYDIAVVTEIGKMHIDTFGSFEAIVKEKMSLVDLLEDNKIAILNYENEFIRNYDVRCGKYTYGFNYGDFTAKNIDLSIYGSQFDLYIYDKFIKRLSIKTLGRSSILNVLPALIMCYLYDINYDVVSKIEQVTNRLSLRKFDDYYILDDAYNSNIFGAIYALEVLNTHLGKKYLITPGFVEMDMIKEELINQYGKEISQTVDYVILVRNEFTILLGKSIKDKEVIFVESFKDGFNLFLRIKEKDSILLIENDLLN